MLVRIRAVVLCCPKPCWQRQTCVLSTVRQHSGNCTWSHSRMTITRPPPLRLPGTAAATARELQHVIKQQESLKAVDDLKVAVEKAQGNLDQILPKLVELNDALPVEFRLPAFSLAPLATLEPEAPLATAPQADAPAAAINPAADD